MSPIEVCSTWNTMMDLLRNLSPSQVKSPEILKKQLSCLSYIQGLTYQIIRQWCCSSFFLGLMQTKALLENSQKPLIVLYLPQDTGNLICVQIHNLHMYDKANKSYRKDSITIWPKKTVSKKQGIVYHLFNQPIKRRNMKKPYLQSWHTRNQDTTWFILYFCICFDFGVQH